MILYSLCCSKDHGFDAWFPNSAAFDKQARKGIVVCPTCGDTDIRKAIMAPRISKGAARGKAVERPPSGPTPPQPQPVNHVMAPQMREMLLELRKQVESNCDYVGDQFAEEARKIHYGETEERGIYGEASDAEAEALREEGIEVGRIPWLPRTN
ncbi:MAG: DUF1178 family protein [Reyranellaceae bacterium]